MEYLTKLDIPELGIPKRGKVRDIYELEDYLLFIASDRISMFDRIMNEPIRDKGRILTELSHFWFEKTKDLVPNHLIDHPDPNILIVKKCKPLMVEMVVRAYLVGSLWRDYRKGKREKCGIPIPDGLNENDPLPNTIVTPSTKNPDGHDVDISKKGLISQGIVTESQWNVIEKYSLNLFKRGQEVAEKNGLILVDTKYEFGTDEKNDIFLIDEIHTPDSSRFWVKKEADKKEFRFPDKEFARQWAIQNGFMGDGELPAIPEPIREQIHQGYRNVFETLTGKQLPDIKGDISERIVANLKKKELIK